jgi:ribosome-binding factor A
VSQRLERVAGEVRAILGEVLARDEIKDPRVRGAGLITVTHVRVSGDLRHARALFTVHDADAAALERVRQGLDHASGYFRQAIARRLRMKVAPAVKFEVDKVFEQAERVEQLLREDAAAHPAPAPAAAPDDADGAGDDDDGGRDDE